MSRFTIHDLDSAPVEARKHLEQYIKTSPTGQILNLHGAMAHAPIVLEMYARMRSTMEDMGQLDSRAQWAAMLAVASVDRSSYSATLYAMLARRYGLTDKETRDITEGADSGDAALDALVRVAREIVSNNGRVNAQTWNGALAAGWSDVQLGQLFASVGLAVFLDYFVNYSEVESDLQKPVGA